MNRCRREKHKIETQKYEGNVIQPNGLCLQRKTLRATFLIYECMSVVQILYYNESNNIYIYIYIYSRLDAIVNRFLVQVRNLVYT